MKVQVAYVSSEIEYLEEVDAQDSMSVEEVIKQSGVLNKFAEISLDHNKIGIFGEIVDLNQIINEGDRIEIYRPLQMNPMEARRLRATMK
ncbi:MAG: RnfH family protein [Pseudomonadota bacterium]